MALWREALLAQAVLRGRTRGYTAHPQLARFRALAAPVGGIAEYLRIVHAEAKRRGYRFAAGKISRARPPRRIEVTRGQLELEWRHLLRKLRKRDPERHARLAPLRSVRAHASFRVVPGGVADWEKTRR